MTADAYVRLPDSSSFNVQDPRYKGESTGRCFPPGTVATLKKVAVTALYLLLGAAAVGALCVFAIPALKVSAGVALGIMAGVAIVGLCVTLYCIYKKIRSMNTDTNTQQKQVVTQQRLIRASQNLKGFNAKESGDYFGGDTVGNSTGQSSIPRDLSNLRANPAWGDHLSG